MPPVFYVSACLVRQAKKEADKAKRDAEEAERAAQEQAKRAEIERRVAEANERRRWVGWLVGRSGCSACCWDPRKALLTQSDGPS